jgi:hypothetical protein
MTKHRLPKSNVTRVFVSHCSGNKPFARLLYEALQRLEVQPWIDENEIYVGENILDRLGEGLRQMDVLIFVISKEALASEWVNREVKFAARREIIERRVMIQPFIIDDTAIDDLPWFLQDRNISRIHADQEGAESAAKQVLQALERRSFTIESLSLKRTEFREDPRIDELLDGIGPGYWKQAQIAALEIIGRTERSGRNDLFESLLTYIDFSQEDEQYAVLQTIESIAQLAPWLITRELIVDMANSKDFSVRSAAASICFDLAHLAPERVPIEVVIKLANYNEDWYVTTPATGALKIMARWRPAILQLFDCWLSSEDADEREHAAAAIADIADREPEILEKDSLSAALEQLNRIGDSTSADYIAKAVSKAQRAVDVYPYKYGRF